MQGNKVIAGSLVIIVVFIGGVVLRLAKPVLFPFFLAIFLSFILYPVLDFLNRLQIPKVVSVIFLLIITFSIIYLLGALFYSSGKAFASEFPKYGQKISSILINLQEKFKLTSLNWESVDWVGQLDINKIGGFFLSSLGPFFSFMSNLFLIFVFLIFILAGRGRTKEKIKMTFDESRGSKIIDVIQNIDSQIQKYLAIKTVVSLITGTLATIVLMIFGVDFAIVFGFFTFLLNYIPTVGSIIATLLPLIIAAFQFDTLWTAFWILLILGSIQMTIGNFVEPKLMGEGLGLSPLVVLFFLFFWGWLWGIPGMILAVPMAAIIKIVCSNVPNLNFVGELMSK
ncbi:MAG: AI-2E family transporter [Candidatus Aminicenantes bacterium]|nr:MAG: AI-2E family transporter [Candidatus Aminicenantes bacterium]